MKFKDWIRNEVKIAKLAEFDENNIMNDYVMSIYDYAEELALKMLEQNHSGMSASLTTKVFNNLVNHIPLTPVTGEEHEWSSEGGFEDQDGNLFQQNIRFSSLFRSRKSLEHDWTYSYNNILEIVNSNDVWNNFPPLDEPGTLDDDDPSVKAYFDSMHELRDELNSRIEFPFKPVTYKYKWNFETLEFEVVE